MTDDFFSDLERQLVAATPDRARRVRRARARTAVTLSTILVALLAGGVGIAAAVSGGGDGGASSGTPAATARTTPAPAPAPTVAPATGLGPTPGTFVVSVLNGTTVPGLARGVANRLQNDHYKIGNVTNAADQAHAETTVYYATPDCVPAAREVAEAIGIRDIRIYKAGRAQRVIAGSSAQVIVVVGSDQNQSPVRRR
jgi:hypothetical protein